MSRLKSIAYVNKCKCFDSSSLKVSDFKMCQKYSGSISCHVRTLQVLWSQLGVKSWFPEPGPKPPSLIPSRRPALKPHPQQSSLSSYSHSVLDQEDTINYF